MEANDIRRAGGDPMPIGGMCNGVEQIVSDIVRFAPSGGVFLLRFHGHGAPGVAGFSAGHGSIPRQHPSSISPDNKALTTCMTPRRDRIYQYGVNSEGTTKPKK